MKEVVSMVMDDEVAEQVQKHSFIKGKRGGRAKAKAPKAVQEEGKQRRRKTPKKDEIAAESYMAPEADVVEESANFDGAS